MSAAVKLPSKAGTDPTGCFGAEFLVANVGSGPEAVKALTEIMFVKRSPNVGHERRRKGRVAAFGTSARWRG